MAHPLMAQIEGLRVDPIQLTHGFGEIGLGRFNDQMEVIVHHAIGVEQEMKAGDHARQHPEKLLPVLVIEKDVLPGIASDRDVIERTGKFETEWSSHEESLAQQSNKKYDLTLFSQVPSHFLSALVSDREGEEAGADRVYAEITHESQCDREARDAVA